MVAHAAVLTVLGLGWLDDDTEPKPVPPYQPIYLDTEPWPFVTGSLRKPASPVGSPETGPLARLRQAAVNPDSPIATERRTTRPADATQAASDPNATASSEGSWTVSPQQQNVAIGRALRGGTLGCRSGFNDLDQQARCEQSFGLAAARAAPILGTDNPARDARFAAEGQAELDAYENLRAPLKPPQKCAGSDMMGRCPAIFTIPLLGKKF